MHDMAKSLGVRVGVHILLAICQKGTYRLLCNISVQFIFYACFFMVSILLLKIKSQG